MNHPDETHILACGECASLIATDPKLWPPFDPEGCLYGLGPDDGRPLAQCPHPAAGASLCERHLREAASNWETHVRETTDALERLANGEEPQST